MTADRSGQELLLQSTQKTCSFRPSGIENCSGGGRSASSAHARGARGARVVAAGAAAPAGAQTADPKVLVFSKTAGFRHELDRDRDRGHPVARRRQRLRRRRDRGRHAVQRGEARRRTRRSCSSRPPATCSNAAQQTAFEDYIQAGGGYAGVHAAADTEYDWGWYGDLVGAYFNSHPANQTATVDVEDAEHPSTACVPAEWARFDEWYNYRANPRPDVNVLATLDESSYSPGGGAMGADHPIAWYHEFDGGRAWYTGMGHTAGVVLRARVPRPPARRDPVRRRTRAHGLRAGGARGARLRADRVRRVRRHGARRGRVERAQPQPGDAARRRRRAAHHDRGRRPLVGRHAGQQHRDADRPVR